MEDHKEKNLTKKQLWDKLHNERIMWQMKLDHDTQQAFAQGVFRARAQIDPILAKVVRAFGTQEGDEWRLDIDPITAEERNWDVRTGTEDERTVTIWARKRPEEVQKDVDALDTNQEETATAK